ncbi:hypothetical protein J4426_00105 [Candidatus Woesearchaeota archaeon]|nr:hypothetical protein [Candidatus Woesearchaeota archaeon]
MNFYYDLSATLQDLGFYDFILPFLLVFTIVFAILEKTKILGVDKDNESKRNINAVIALVLGLLIVNQFEIVQSLNTFLPKISFFIVIALMVLILFGLFGANVERGLGGILLLAAAVISLIATYWALGPSLDFRVPYWVEDNVGTITAGLIVLIIIFGVISKPGDSSSTRLDNMTKAIDKMFGKGT